MGIGIAILLLSGVPIEFIGLSIFGLTIGVAAMMGISSLTKFIFARFGREEVVRLIIAFVIMFVIVAVLAKDFLTGLFVSVMSCVIAIQIYKTVWGYNHIIVAERVLLKIVKKILKFFGIILLIAIPFQLLCSVLKINFLDRNWFLLLAAVVVIELSFWKKFKIDT
jgi:hypothetical protein